MDLYTVTMMAEYKFWLLLIQVRFSSKIMHMFVPVRHFSVMVRHAEERNGQGLFPFCEPTGKLPQFCPIGDLVAGVT